MSGPKRGIVLFTCVLAAVFCVCSDDPAAPEVRQWDNSELIGQWSGELDLLAMVPDSSFPYWPGWQTHPLFGRRYDLRGLEASVNFTSTEFLILLQYRSDSLYFLYQERGEWRLSGGDPPLLRMDSTRVTGRLERWDAQVNWDTSGCCWQAGVEIRDADPGSAGFGEQLLRLSNIRGRVSVGELRLEREKHFQLP